MKPGTVRVIHVPREAYLTAIAELLPDELQDGRWAIADRRPAADGGVVVELTRTDDDDELYRRILGVHDPAIVELRESLARLTATVDRLDESGVVGPRVDRICLRLDYLERQDARAVVGFALVKKNAAAIVELTDRLTATFALLRDGLERQEALAVVAKTNAAAIVELRESLARLTAIWGPKGHEKNAIAIGELRSDLEATWSSVDTLATRLDAIEARSGGAS